MNKITPFLWFDTQAEEAANFYVSVFANSRIVEAVRYGDAGNGPKGGVMVISFELQGVPFTALNGGPVYSFTPAVSFVAHCADQAEVDHLWDALTAGGKPVQCGWLTDRYGVSWQVVPERLLTLIKDPDPAKAKRVTEAMLQMIKIDVAALEKAYAG
jgi:predicted 3-demethylubiquinone-9 3-methyltransferase (glyoxalase superfamily)